MFCRGIYKEDGLEYEGLITSVESTDDGQYALVEFVGYGNQETLWLQELLEVRKFQKKKIWCLQFSPKKQLKNFPDFCPRI
jgi:hypothetical protein